MDMVENRMVFIYAFRITLLTCMEGYGLGLVLMLGLRLGALSSPLMEPVDLMGL